MLCSQLLLLGDVNNNYSSCSFVTYGYLCDIIHGCVVNLREQVNKFVTQVDKLYWKV